MNFDPYLTTCTIISSKWIAGPPPNAKMTFRIRLVSRIKRGRLPS